MRLVCAEKCWKKFRTYGMLYLAPNSYILQKTSKTIMHYQQIYEISHLFDGTVAQIIKIWKKNAINMRHLTHPITA